MASIVSLLILVITANSAPVLLARIMGNRLGRPIDGGARFVDGRPLLGGSKTWRGVIGAAGTCAAIAPLLGYSAWTGLCAGLLAMTGDLLSSFSKRRLGLTASAKAPLLDQVPESLLPAAVLKSTFQLGWLDVGLVIAVFIILETVFSVLFFRLGIRKHPY